VYSIDGRLIHDLQNRNGSTEINLGESPSGVYFIKKQSAVHNTI